MLLYMSIDYILYIHISIYSVRSFCMTTNEFMDRFIDAIEHNIEVISVSVNFLFLY